MGWRLVEEVHIRLSRTASYFRSAAAGMRSRQRLPPSRFQFIEHIVSSLPTNLKAGSQS